jgi:hypothetical protein
MDILANEIFDIAKTFIFSILFNFGVRIRAFLLFSGIC